jgi:Na+/H+ antiporter
MGALSEVVVFLAIAIIGTALARRIGVLAPILLVAAGVGLSFVPFLPQVRLDPQLVLTGLLPPLLYIAALESSVPALRHNVRPILLLAVGLVLFTAGAVAVVTHALLPQVPFAACLALGAVVAPPDAIAASAVARRVGLPRQLVSILEGESLINDATALVLLHLAVTAALGMAVGPGEVTVELFRVAGGGLVVGVVGALIFDRLHRWLTDPVLENTLSLLTPFAVVIVAELVGVSGVVAVVTAGLALGHRMPVLLSAASRLQLVAFWRLAKFLLEGLVFLLVGLQLPEVLANLPSPPGQVVAITLAVLAAVLLGRFVWILPGVYLSRLVPRIRRGGPPVPIGMPVVVAWAGMRGVVTLAAALTLPLTLADGAAYPRELFVYLALAVIVTTLVAQGATLPAVARLTRLPVDDPRRDARAEAAVQQEATHAARRWLEEHAGEMPTDALDLLRRTVREARGRADGSAVGPLREYDRVRHELIDIERRVFRDARDRGRISEEALNRAYRALDLEESLLRHHEQG